MDAHKKLGPVTPGGMSTTSFPIPGDDAADLGPMPEGDDNLSPPEGPRLSSGLNDLSFSRDSVGGASAVGGLDDSTDHANAPPPNPPMKIRRSRKKPPNPRSERSKKDPSVVVLVARWSLTMMLPNWTGITSSTCCRILRILPWPMFHILRIGPRMRTMELR